MQHIEPQLLIALDVLIASILGGVLGLEREMHAKPAGFRTQMFIAGAAALMLSLGRVLAQRFDLFLSEDALGVDPTRIIHAIVVGVSFIGAGTVLKSPGDDTIKFLTTAAMTLFSAGIGMAVAMQLYILAILVTVLGLIINTVMRRWQRSMDSNRSSD